MLSLSPGDVQQLGTAMRLFLSPHDFQHDTAWRLAICEHLLTWIHTDAVHLTIPGSVSPPMVGAGRWGPSVSREYVATWHNRQEVDDERIRRNLRVWVRHQTISRDDFRRTRYFGEFCAQHRILDSAGVSHRLAGGEDVVLHFSASHHDIFPPGGRTHAIIALLHPTLVAGTTALRALGDGNSGLLDASARAIAVLSLDGSLQHMTPRLATLAIDPAIGAALRTAMKQLAAEAGRLLRTGSLRDPVKPSLRVTVRGKRLVATASIVRERLSNTAPVCLVVVTEERAPLDSSASGCSLTARERQVAELLALGERNRGIAAALGITEHTARRHTERVLTKLGVRSRAAVAGVLDRNALSSPDDAPNQTRS